MQHTATPISDTRQRVPAKDAQAEVDRRDVAFTSDGVTCRAWLYVPSGDRREKLPVVVMAHGLGGTREGGLEPYAKLFAREGFLVLLFDYRNLGASDGAPRQLVSIRKQLEDWEAAIAFARGLAEADPDRVALWGTSLSGGHAVVLAARDPRIAAISAQCPMLDGLLSSRMVRHDLGPRAVLRHVGSALLDWMRAGLGMSPLYVPLVGKPGTHAAMASHDAYEGVMAIMPSHWRNELAARFFLSMPLYRPKKYARAVKCPALFIACQKDSVVSTKATVETAKRMGQRARLIELPIGHFDVYRAGFEQTSQAQLAFLNEALRQPRKAAAI